MSIRPRYGFRQTVMDLYKDGERADNGKIDAIHLIRKLS